MHQTNPTAAGLSGGWAVCAFVGSENHRDRDCDDIEIYIRILFCLPLGKFQFPIPLLHPNPLPPLQPIFHSCSHHQPDVISVVVLTWVRVHRNQCSRFHFCFFSFNRYQESALFNLHNSWSLHSKSPSVTSLIYYNNSPILVRKRDFLVKTDTLAHGSILCGSSQTKLLERCHQILLYTTHHTQERTHYTSAYVADGQQNAVIPNVLLSRYFLRFGLKIRFSRFQRARQTIRCGS